MPRSLMLLSLVFAAWHCAYAMGAAMTTALVLARVGVAGTSLVQGAPLLATCVAAPFVGLSLDKRPAGRTVRVVLAALGARALAFLWFDWRWYAALSLLDVLALPALHAAYAGLVPTLAAGRDVGRASGWISAMQNLARALGAAAGPLLAFQFGTAGFVAVATGFGIAAALALALPPVAAGAEPDPVDESGPASLARGLAEGARRVAASGEDRRLLLLLALASLCWGVGEVVAQRIAAEGFGVTAQWSGVYVATALAAEVGGCLLVGAGLVNTQANLLPKVGLCVAALGATFVGAGLARAPALGFALKTMEGLASVLVGLLSGPALVLRKDAAVRGRIAGLMAVLSGLPELGGKALAFWSEGRTSARALSAGVGLAVLAGALALIGAGQSRGGRAPSARQGEA